MSKLRDEVDGMVADLSNEQLIDTLIQRVEDINSPRSWQGAWIDSLKAELVSRLAPAEEASP